MLIFTGGSWSAWSARPQTGRAAAARVVIRVLYRVSSDPHRRELVMVVRTATNRKGCGSEGCNQGSIQGIE